MNLVIVVALAGLMHATRSSSAGAADGGAATLLAFGDLLVSADRVKFGKGAATRDDAREALQRARRLHAHVEAREAARRAAEAAREKAS